MIGQTISHFKILEKLGEGGMGVVYKARDTELQRDVALKFLPPSVSSDAGEKERFYQEARAAAALNHQNIAVIHEIGEHEGQLYLAMELVDGQTLKTLIQRGEPLSIVKVLEIAIQLCEGLGAAHEKGVVHRDIKSDNIMLTPKGRLKVMDFGLAKVKNASKLTQVGSTVGTAAYMSPEQAQGEDVDLRSDIFSFGVVLYELLTGHLPFRGDHQAALLYSLVNEDPLPVARFNDKVSQDLERVVFKALAKDKEERYQHVDDVLADLRREKKNTEYVRSGYIKASTVGPVHIDKTTDAKSRKNNVMVRIIIPSAVVLVIAVLFFVFNPFHSTEHQTSGPAGNSLAVMYFENIPDPADHDHTSEMLTNLLITSLSQVKDLDVISRERLLTIQKDLGQTDVKTISATVAEQVAKRAGVSTMLIGSILQEKPLCAVTTRLIDVQSGRILSSQQVTNFSANEIFKLVDTLSLLIQNNLQVASAPGERKSVADVTTSSPEAYRAYVAGLELDEKIYTKEAAAAFSRAIELDKTFAMAYYHLYAEQFALGQVAASRRSLRAAVELAGKATERERLQILATNYLVQNDVSKAAEGFEQLVKLYPRDIYAYQVLGWNVYFRMSLEPEKAVGVFRRGLENVPSAKILWNDMAYSLASLNRRQDAVKALNEYINLAPAEPNPYDTKGDIYTLFMEYDSSRAWYRKAIGLRGDFISAYKLGFDAVLRQHYDDAGKYFDDAGFQLPIIDAHRGKLQSARKEFIQLPESQISESDRLRRLIHLSVAERQFPEMLRLAQLLVTELKKDPGDIIYGRDYLAWAFIKNEKPAEAHKLQSEMQNDVGDGPRIAQLTVDYSSGLLALEEGENEQALKTFRRVFQAFPPIHEPNIFFGVTLLKTGQIAEAIAEFQRLLYWSGSADLYLAPAIPGAFYDWPMSAVKAHYWLGMAYEKQGNSKGALDEYKKFLDIWKDADFESPELDNAKTRISKLEGISQK